MSARKIVLLLLATLLLTVVAVGYLFFTGDPAITAAINKLFDQKKTELIETIEQAAATETPTPPATEVPPPTEAPPTASTPEPTQCPTAFVYATRLPPESGIWWAEPTPGTGEVDRVVDKQITADCALIGVQSNWEGNILAGTPIRRQYANEEDVGPLATLVAPYTETAAAMLTAVAFTPPAPADEPTVESTPTS